VGADVIPNSLLAGLGEAVTASKARGWAPSLAFLVLMAGAAFTAGGCADAAGEAMRQDLAQLRQDLNATNLSVRRSRGETDAVLGQLDRRVREANDVSQKLASRLDSVHADLGRLAGRLEEITQRLDALSRQPARPAPAPSRAPVPSPPPTAAVPSIPGTPAPATPGAPSVPARPPAEGLTPEQVYQSAYLDFSKGNYPLAVSGFREFVRRFPDSDLADNAQYWIGESYFSMARSSAGQGQAERMNQALEHAVQEFRKVPLNYPRGDKVPTAIYKEGLALVELRQTKAAQARLQYLVDHFPQSEEAPLARERLAALASDGGERRRDSSSP
jgi:tol-pal system protein YbgF